MIRISTTAIRNGEIDLNRRLDDATENGTFDVNVFEASYAKSLSRVSRLEGAVVPALALWQNGGFDYIALAFAQKAADILGVAFDEVNDEVKIRRYFTLAASKRESFSKRVSGYTGQTQAERQAEVLARMPKTDAKGETVKADPFATFRQEDTSDDTAE